MVACRGKHSDDPTILPVRKALMTYVREAEEKWRIYSQWRLMESILWVWGELLQWMAMPGLCSSGTEEWHLQRGGMGEVVGEKADTVTWLYSDLWLTAVQYLMTERRMPFRSWLYMWERWRLGEAGTVWEAMWRGWEEKPVFLCVEEILWNIVTIGEWNACSGLVEGWYGEPLLMRTWRRCLQ